MMQKQIVCTIPICPVTGLALTPGTVDRIAAVNPRTGEQWSLEVSKAATALDTWLASRGMVRIARGRSGADYTKGRVEHGMALLALNKLSSGQ